MSSCPGAPWGLSGEGPEGGRGRRAEGVQAPLSQALGVGEFVGFSDSQKEMQLSAYSYRRKTRARVLSKASCLPVHSFIHSFIRSFIPHMLIGHLLYAMHGPCVGNRWQQRAETKP